MDKNSDDIETSTQLFELLSKIEGENTGTFRDELSLGSKLSLWDVLATFLVLYRFPIVFSDNSNFGLARVKQRFRPIIGLIGRTLDETKFFKNTQYYKNKYDEVTEECLTADKTILVLGFSITTYRDVLSSVVDQLVHLKNIRLIVLYDEDEPNSLAETVSIWSQWHKSVKNRCAELNVQFNRVQLEFLTSDKIKKYMSGSSGSYQALKEEMQWLSYREFPRLIKRLAIAEHILQKYKPNLLITADDADQSCRLYSLLAKKESVNTLVVQQGITDKTYPDWRYFSGSKIACMGEDSKQNLLAQGVSSTAIKITGHPGFDILFKRKEHECNKLRIKLSLAKDEKIILFASQPYYVNSFSSKKCRRDMLLAVSNIISYFPQIKFIIKPHPYENVSEISLLFNKNENAIIMDSKIDISILIKISDVVMTMFSQSGLQALLLGKPVINIIFPGSVDRKSYADKGASWLVSNSIELKLLLEKYNETSMLLRTENMENKRLKLIKDTVYSADGKSTHRVIDLVQEMLQADI